MTAEVIVGDARAVLADLAPGSLHSAISSYPYFGLRSYLEVAPLVWGGDPVCVHEWGDVIERPGQTPQKGLLHTGNGVAETRVQRFEERQARPSSSASCSLCGAWHGHWGLEPTFEMWVEHCVEVSRAVRRALRDEGTFWLNIGHSYTGSRSTGTFKSKDLVMQGPLLAEALRRDGWYLRSHIIWSKRSVLPESVTDRPASSYEHVFLLTKSDCYFYDHAAVRQPYAEKSKPQVGTKYKGQNTKDRDDGSQDASDTKRRVIASMEARGGRNLRNVWEEPHAALDALRLAVATRDPKLPGIACGFTHHTLVGPACSTASAISSMAFQSQPSVPSDSGPVCASASAWSSGRSTNFSHAA